MGDDEWSEFKKQRTDFARRRFPHEPIDDLGFDQVMALITENPPRPPCPHCATACLVILDREDAEDAPREDGMTHRCAACGKQCALPGHGWGDATPCNAETPVDTLTLTLPGVIASMDVFKV